MLNLVTNGCKLLIGSLFPDPEISFTKQEDKADLEREKGTDRINTSMWKKIKEHEDMYNENNIRDFVDLYILVSKDNKVETKDTFTSKTYP